MTIVLEMEGDEKLVRKLRTTQVRARKISKRLPNKMAKELRNEVRSQARRFRRTGGYEASIVTRGGIVLTKHPAARRLEKGFVGRDSMGRIYHQAPRPHWRPAIEKIKKRMREEAAKELGLGD